jgi:hypothetical protein
MNAVQLSIYLQNIKFGAIYRNGKGFFLPRPVLSNETVEMTMSI